MSAHAVDAAAWRRRRTAQIDAWVAGSIAADGGAEEELGEGHVAAGDVAAEEVGVPGGEGFGVAGAAGEDAVAEAGGEAGDLGLDDGGAVYDGAVGDVAVGPGGVFSCGRACGVEEAGLDEEHVGAVVVAAVEGVVLGAGDFFERFAEVYGGRAGALGGAPGDGPAEGEVELEDAGTALEAAEALEIAG